MSDEFDADAFLSEVREHMREERRKEDPDYSNTVYCDQHVGVKMRLAPDWNAHEWRSLDGEAHASTNPNLLWFCPKPGCERHYDPRMFGYHVNEPGLRSKDASTQPRGNHGDRPFMYIAKEGEGRMYRCPLYKCDEVGSVVAESVVDEEVSLPPDALAGLKSAERKRALEMLVFLSFARASGLAIDEGSPENRDPDYPDILCTISGQKYWFELGRIINEKVAEKLNPNQRKLSGGFSFSQEQPFVDVVKDKTTKRYKTENAPVDLILHYDLRGFLTEATAQGLCQENEALLASLTTTGPFKRVWVFDETKGNVVWSLSK